MLVKYLPEQAPLPFQYSMMQAKDTQSIQLPSLSHLLASTAPSTTSTSCAMDSPYNYEQQQYAAVAGISRRQPQVTREEFMQATQQTTTTTTSESAFLGPQRTANKLSLSREGLPYDAEGGATMMLGMREALCQFSIALEHATTRQDQADIYFQRANLYYKYGLHAEALRDCNNSYYCFPSPNAVQLRNIIAKKFQAAQYEFNETGINILKEKLQHAMQERSGNLMRQ